MLSGRGGLGPVVSIRCLGSVPSTSHSLSSGHTGLLQVFKLANVHPPQGLRECRSLPWEVSPAIRGFSPTLPPHPHSVIKAYAKKASRLPSPCTPFAVCVECLALCLLNLGLRSPRAGRLPVPRHRPYGPGPQWALSLNG